MILNRNESEVTILGDVQKYKVSIDEKNLQHIITILSSNLYSHPMQSFLREIVSNAVDSHIEAGVNEPIIITITDNDLAIRDFGTGISPERFRDVFINIGSSTKRDSNGFIGYFGIGKYASLAVADVVNITSFYDGKAYYYVMNKDIDQLHIDLILEKDTDEHNGVEVKIPFKEPLSEEDWEGIAFIKNVYIEDERKYPTTIQGSIVSSLNKRKVYSYNNFKLLELGYPYSNNRHTTQVLIGSIPYKVDCHSLWEDNLYLNWEDTFKRVFPCLNIGEVDITPNREGLLYSERTKAALRKAYDNTIQELTELWEKACNEEYTDFKAFAFAVKSHYENRLNLQGINIPINDDLPYNIKMKDFPFFEFKELKEVIRTILLSTTDSIIARYDNGEMQKSKRLLESTIEKILCKCEDDNITIIAAPNAHGFSSKYIKGFLSERFSYKRVLLLKELRISPTKIKSFIRTRFGITVFSDSKKVHLIIACLRHLIKYFNGHVRKWDIINSPEYIQYKEDNREEKVNIRDNTKIPCCVWLPYNCSPKKLTCTPNQLIKDLRSQDRKCRIVYAQLENPFIYGFNGISYPKLIIIGLAQNNYALAEKGLFPDFVRPIEELYSADNRVLQKIAAVEYIRNTVPIQELPVAFPKPVRDMTEKLMCFIDRYPHKTHDYRFYDAYNILKVVPEEKYDKTILALFHQVKKYQEIYYTIKNSYRYNVAFFWYFLMKAKKFRLDYDYYKCVKDDIKHITNLL